MVATTPFPAHTAEHPCPVCGGHPGLPQGHGIRCAGGTLDHVIYCTREEYAGTLPLEDTSPPAYKHRRSGRCACGHEHGRGPGAVSNPNTSTLRRERREAQPIETRDRIYHGALALLDLRTNALADLTRRGLSAADAYAFGYRSIPRKGRDLERFINAMIERFGEAVLQQCPGFTDKNGRLTFWSAVGERDGYIVPYVDECSRITGIQLKLLNERRQLVPAGAVLHAVYNVAGPPGGDLYITEGGTKGKVASALGDIWTFGVVGQGLMPEHIEVIKRLAPTRVIVALDEETNDNTDKARQHWVRLLADTEIPVYRAVWEGSDLGGPKGLDDLFAAGERPRLRFVASTPSGISARRHPVAVAEGGAVATGAALADVRASVQRDVRSFVEHARKNAGRAVLIRADPGVGKTSAVQEAVRRAGITAAYVVGTRSLADEVASATGWDVVRARAQTCHPDRLPVVQALSEKGFPVGMLACGTPDEPRCPFRRDCLYFQQIHGRSRVGTTEQLYNPRFLRGASLLVVDDANLSRALIERHVFSDETLQKAVGQIGTSRDAAWRLVQVLRHAVIDAPRNPNGRGGPPLLNAAAWDHLARTARRNGEDIITLVEALPANSTLPLPAGDDEGVIHVEAVDAAPPYSLVALFAELQEELDDFRRGEDFNSRIRIHAEGINLWRPRAHATRRRPKPGEFEVFVEEMAMLVLDATPVPTLVNHLTQHHVRLPDVTGKVELSPGVRVVQFADAGNGHTAQKYERRRQAIAEQVEAMRARYPVASPDREAVVAFKKHRAEWESAGFEPSHVLTFGRARGTNAVENVERLHIAGRPMPPPVELVYLASVMHRDEPPISGALTLTRRTYGGQLYAVDVVDFADGRITELLVDGRDSEITQMMHRARLLTVDPQLRLPGVDGGGAGVEGNRRGAVLVLHSNHPVPGLRVDELILPHDSGDRNAARACEAEQRVGSAVQRLIERGEQPTLSTIAREARCSKQTAAKYVGNAVHTLQRNSLYGVYQCPQTPASGSGDFAHLDGDQGVEMSDDGSVSSPMATPIAAVGQNGGVCHACRRKPVVRFHPRCQECLIEAAVANARSPD